MSYTEEGEPVAQVVVTELKTTERLPSASFEVPVGAVSKPNCLNPTVGLLVKKATPSYPESEKRGGVQ
jgi:hypothetical protein